MAIDTQEIRDTFLSHFDHGGDFTVDPDTGIVSCTGRVFLTLDVPELPVVLGRVGGDLDISVCDLASLRGCPITVGRDFDCQRNRLKSLEGGPQRVSGNYMARDNHLASLKGAPRWVGGTFYLSVYADMPLLDLLLMEKCGKLWLTKPGKPNDVLDDLQELITRYIGSGYDGMVPCAARMHKLGHGSNARMG